MKSIKVKTPAKINLTLEVLDKRPDGFHNIQSIMQAISLYDYLTIKVSPASENILELSGNSDEIPYNEKNIAYKAWELFFKTVNLDNYKTEIYIEKNIPVCAGLAGGSTNAAGVFYGLNCLFDNILSREQLHGLCAQLGSDLNFCLEGGTALCTGRGENIVKLPTVVMPVSLIKPRKLEITAKEAYAKFAQLPETLKEHPDNSTKLQHLLRKGKFDKNLLYNSLENAVIHEHKELNYIKSAQLNAFMSGSGPTFFVVDTAVADLFNKADYQIFNDLKFITDGASTLLSK